MKATITNRFYIFQEGIKTVIYNRVIAGVATVFAFLFALRYIRAGTGGGLY